MAILFPIIFSCDLDAVENISRDHTIYVDFQESMGKKYEKNFSYYKLQDRSERNFDFFEKLYKKNINLIASKNTKIPKIIHQIWLGPNEISEISKIYMKSWIKMHPDWKYILWTDEDIKNWEFNSKNFYYLARTYQEKAEILKYEILYKYGGLYVDVDEEALKPFDELHHKYSIYAGINPPSRSIGKPILATGIIGAAPKHKVILETMLKLKKKWHMIGNSFDNGIYNMSYLDLARQRVTLPFTDSFIEIIKNEDSDAIALPPTYFYPIYYDTLSKKSQLINNIKMWLTNKISEKPFSMIKPESYAAHNYSNKKSFIYEPDFEISMNYQNSLFFEHPKHYHYFKFFEELYKINKPSNVNFNKVSKIPQVIHFIYLSTLDIPEKYKKNIASFRLNHPEWEIKIWNKHDIENIKSPYLSKLNSAYTENDLIDYARLIILEKFGGLCVDLSMESLKNMDELNNKYSFYAGFMANTVDREGIYISKRVVASTAHHEILVNTLRDEYIKTPFSDFFTFNIYRYGLLGGRTIIFPTTFFYPINKNPGKISRLQKFLKFVGVDVKIPFQEIMPESFTNINSLKK